MQGYYSKGQNIILHKVSQEARESQEKARRQERGKKKARKSHE